MYSIFTPSVAFSKSMCHEHHFKARQHYRNKKSNLKHKSHLYYFILLWCFLSVVNAKSEQDINYSDRTRLSEDKNSFAAKGK